jgi:hypothetical protein
VLITIVFSVAALWLVGFAGFYYAMCQKPETFGNVMKHTGPAPFLIFPFETMWKSARGGHLNIGDAAPDFTLPRLDHTGTVRLSSNRGVRPVVLIFGSYT